MHNNDAHHHVDASQAKQDRWVPVDGALPNVSLGFHWKPLCCKFEIWFCERWGVYCTSTKCFSRALDETDTPVLGRKLRVESPNCSPFLYDYWSLYN